MNDLQNNIIMVRYNGKAFMMTMYMLRISFMLLLWMRLMVLMLVVPVLTFMTMMMIRIMILVMILTMILMMMLMIILMMILMMVGAGTEDRSQDEPYAFPTILGPPFPGGRTRVGGGGEESVRLLPGAVFGSRAHHHQYHHKHHH